MWNFLGIWDNASAEIFIPMAISDFILGMSFQGAIILIRLNLRKTISLKIRSENRTPFQFESPANIESLQFDL